NLPEQLRNELQRVALERSSLAANLQGSGHHSRSEIRDNAVLLDSKRRREMQIPKEILEAERRLPDVQWSQYEAGRRLGDKELAWAKEGGEERVVFYAADRLKNDPDARERLFREFSEQSGIAVNILKMRFHRLARVSDDAKQEPEPISEPKTVGKRQRNGSGRIGVGRPVDTISVPAIVDGNNGTGPERYEKPTSFQIVLGVGQEAQPVDSTDQLKVYLRKINGGLGSLAATDVWNKVNQLSQLRPGDMAHLHVVPVGPYKGWATIHLGKNWKIFFKFSGQRQMTFTIGTREDLNRLR
ncbi:MAG: hypothetical protein WD988_00210, partial [Candidatus Curtissbacteria bacterium]